MEYEQVMDHKKVEYKKLEKMSLASKDDGYELVRVKGPLYRKEDFHIIPSGCPTGRAMGEEYVNKVTNFSSLMIKKDVDELVFQCDKLSRNLLLHQKGCKTCGSVAIVQHNRM